MKIIYFLKFYPLALFFIFISCNLLDEDAASPYMKGDWELVMVNGDPVPGLVNDPDPNSSNLIEIRNGKLNFSSRDWSFSFRIISMNNTFTGEYTFNGNSLNINWTGYHGLGESYDELVDEGFKMKVNSHQENNLELIFSRQDSWGWTFLFEKRPTRLQRLK